MDTIDAQVIGAEDLAESVFEYAYEHGWTDGFPIIPPTPARVERMVVAVKRDPSEEVAVLPPRKGRATVEKIAANAVMAGCKPEYLPVVIAAVEAVADPSYRLEGVQVTTNPVAPFILINGPIRREIDVNCGLGCLGPGWRANATIGRALRLILLNIGGALPGVYARTTFSSPLRYTFCCGENEEDSPWEPFHVEQGFSAGTSTVTVYHASAYMNISGGQGDTVEDTLKQIAAAMPPMFGGRDGALLLLGLNHAKGLAGYGLSKKDIRQAIFEFARLPESRLARDFVEMERHLGRVAEGMVRRFSRPEVIHIVVAGGPGPQDVYIPAGFAVTREVRR
ncbi:hypothetical protein ACFLTY_03125 [Chloroflexota bacterium]